jgi:hypothetical protein
VPGSDDVREVEPSSAVAVSTSTEPGPAAKSPDQWPKDSNDSRLLLGPTARSLKRGEAYVDDLSLFFPSVQVGLSDRVSIGAGTLVALPQADVHPGDAVWITPKVQVFHGRKTQVALGLVHAVVVGHHGGLGYGVVTHGTSNAAITLGLGLAYPQDEHRRPVALVGAEKRVSPGVKLITENYLTARYGAAFLSGGMRLMKGRHTVDLAWFKVPGGSVYPIPMIRFAYQISGPVR